MKFNFDVKTFDFDYIYNCYLFNINQNEIEDNR